MHKGFPMTLAGVDLNSISPIGAISGQGRPISYDQQHDRTAKYYTLDGILSDEVIKKILMRTPA